MVRTYRVSFAVAATADPERAATLPVLIRPIKALQALG
jgi:hypothetical protein